LTVIAQDPAVKIGGKILRTQVEVPNEVLKPGPEGYRVRIVDYDSTTRDLYKPKPFDDVDRYAKADDEQLLSDPGFHAQNTYALVMATLSRFEYALGRRVGWSLAGHQLKVAPHAFCGANAFYSERDEALCFGYFPGRRGQMVFSCLSRDVVAHETTHAILDGLRTRYTEPSSPDQAAFHEGFSDVVALLSVFSNKDVVDALLPRGQRPDTVPRKALTPEKLKQSALLGLAEEMGQEMQVARGSALRRSVERPPGNYLDQPEFGEPHMRGEIFAAAVLSAFVQVWAARLLRSGVVVPGEVARERAVEDGADVANRLLSVVIRAIDYAPPVDLRFTDYLSALLTADMELFPDDTRYEFRKVITSSFAAYGIEPATDADTGGVWQRFSGTASLHGNHFESLQSSPEEMFRFVWENQKVLGLYSGAYCRIQSVRPSIRQGSDGFFLRETVAEYTEIITLKASEVSSIRVPARGPYPATRVDVPDSVDPDQPVTLYGGGTLIFDEFGQLKYHIKNFLDSHRQSERLENLATAGFFQDGDHQNRIARLHMQRATGTMRI
jgi:hypothetical protein